MAFMDVNFGRDFLARICGKVRSHAKVGETLKADSRQQADLLWCESVCSAALKSSFR